MFFAVNTIAMLCIILIAIPSFRVEHFLEAYTLARNQYYYLRGGLRTEETNDP